MYMYVYYISMQRGGRREIGLQVAWKLSPHIIQVFSAVRKGYPLLTQQVFQVSTLPAKCSAGLNLKPRGKVRGRVWPWGSKLGEEHRYMRRGESDGRLEEENHSPWLDCPRVRHSAFTPNPSRPFHIFLFQGFGVGYLLNSVSLAIPVICAIFSSLIP